MRFCTNCGHRLEDDAVRCPSCGTPVETRVGTPNNAGMPRNPQDGQYGGQGAPGNPNGSQYGGQGVPRNSQDGQYGGQGSQYGGQVSRSGQYNPAGGQGGPNSWQYSQDGARYEAQRQYNDPVSVGEWILTTFLVMIPFVGLILLIVWSLSSTINPNKRNFCRAMLVWQIIAIILVAVMTVLFGNMYVRYTPRFSYTFSLPQGWFSFL